MDEQKLKLLVVDNSTLDREFIKDIFSDFECYEATNGQEAINLIKNVDFKFDIILLDVIMPIMDGFSTMLELKRMDLLNEIPVVIMTADKNSLDDINAIDFGVAEVMYKPIATNLCRRRVLNVIEAYKYRKLFGEIVK